MFKSKLFEVLIIELVGVVMFHLLAIFQGDGSWFKLLVIAIRILAILLLLGRSPFDPTGVFIQITSIRVLPEDFLLQFFHGMEVGTIWIGCHSSVDAGMHVVQTWIPDLAKQVPDLCRLIDDVF